MFETIISFFLGLFIGIALAYFFLKNKSKSKSKREHSLADSSNSVLASNANDDMQTLGYETNLAWKTEQSVFNQATGAAQAQVQPQIIEVGQPPLSEVQLELQRLNAKLNEREKVFYPDQTALQEAEQEQLASAAVARLAEQQTAIKLAPNSHETHNTQANEFELAALVSSMQESVTPAASHFEPSELEAIALESAEFDGIDFENEEQLDKQKAADLAAAQAILEAQQEEQAQQAAAHQAQLAAEQLVQAEQAALAAARQEALHVAEQAQKLEQERVALAAQLEAEHAARLKAVAEENARVAATVQLALEAEQQAAEQAAEVARLEQERINYAALEKQAAEQTAQLQASLEAQRVAEENARKEAQAQRAAEQEALAEQAKKVQAQLAAEAAAKADALLAQAAAFQAQEKAAQDELRRIENQELETLRLAAQTAAALLARTEAVPAAALPPAPAASQPGVAKSPENTMIMVADDSKVVRIKISRALSKHNYQITLAENGVEAASKIAENQPDVLITDVEMPGMDGFALTQQLRSKPDTMHLPIIMISGASHELADKAKQAGIDVMLGKPYSDDELIGHIQRLLQR